MIYRDCEIAPFKGMYKIYENGDVWSYKRKVFLKPQYVGGKTLFMKVLLITEGIKRWFGVHHLVLHHFVSPLPEGGAYVCKWKDGNRRNNHFSNLQWETHQEMISRVRGERPWKTGRKKGCVVSEEARRNMSKAKCKVVLVYNEEERIKVLGIEKVAVMLGTYRKKVERYAGGKKKLGGYRIKIL